MYSYLTYICYSYIYVTYMQHICGFGKGINMFVVSEAVLKCLQLIELCHGQNSVLYGYNTDGIYISNPKKTIQKQKGR